MIEAFSIKRCDSNGFSVTVDVSGFSLVGVFTNAKDLLAWLSRELGVEDQKADGALATAMVRPNPSPLSTYEWSVLEFTNGHCIEMTFGAAFGAAIEVLKARGLLDRFGAITEVGKTALAAHKWGAS